MEKKLLFTVLIASSLCLAQAQPTSLVNYNGLFRFYFTNNNLSGDRLNGDTTSVRKGNQGYALFDLGLNINPFKDFKVSAIIRTKANIGQFFQAGNLINFRQLRIEGRIAKVVKYQIGDIDLGMTEYTLYNPDETYKDYEGDVYKMRRDIVSYENFNFGNKWRLQGGQAETEFAFNKGIEGIKIGALATRIRKANIPLSQPDRFIVGANAKLNQGRWFELGGNWVNVFDNIGTTLDSNFEYNNHVLTGEFKFHFINAEKLRLSLGSEFGSSNYKYTIQKKTVEKSDFFYDFKGEVETKNSPVNFKVFGGYREVGPQFTSPGAQTIRVFNNNLPLVFGQQDRLIAGPRQQNLYDRMTDESLYNQTVLTVLLPYLPIYGNVTPYGPATPNRRGYTFGASVADTAGIISADAKAQILTEVIGEGTSDLRGFTAVQGGLKLGIGKLVKIDRDISINFGIRNEKTTRGGVSPIDFSSNLIDLGLQAETFKRFDILLGAKLLSGKGNELIARRDIFNNVTTYYNQNVLAGGNAELMKENFFAIVNQDQRQVILSGGVRYRFFTRSFASINYNMINVNNATSTSAADASYSTNQLFLNLTFIF